MRSLKVVILLRLHRNRNQQGFLPFRRWDDDAWSYENKLEALFHSEKEICQMKAKDEKSVELVCKELLGLSRRTGLMIGTYSNRYRRKTKKTKCAMYM